MVPRGFRQRRRRAHHHVPQRTNDRQAARDALLVRARLVLLLELRLRLLNAPAHNGGERFDELRRRLGRLRNTKHNAGELLGLVVGHRRAVHANHNGEISLLVARRAKQIRVLCLEPARLLAKFLLNECTHFEAVSAFSSSMWRLCSPDASLRNDGT